ncbi:uncharacterized protein LOC132551218 [Ylistrum balloti]|uniref:uncharacterized protein LOC132551218 n=1 Tax=Ylistrum balloti TaxID=509963 RepID=UPI0029058CAD|nr:uncharacterized protein LOC132551218 [Ylistrum balloti]
MLDNTTSEVDIIRCVALPECSELQHTVASSDYHMCHTGIRTRCHCDIDKGYCGDPCKCSLPKDSCKPGEIRLHNCTCVQPRQDPSISVQTTSTIEVPTFRPENFTEATVTTKPDTTTDHELLTPSTTVSDKIMKQQPLDKAKYNSEWPTPGGLAGIIILTVIVTLLGAVAVLNRELIKKKCESLWKTIEGYRRTSSESS